MDKEEAILDELYNFEQKKPNKIPQILDDYLIDIAKTGKVIYPWEKIQPLFVHKLQQVIEDFHEQCPTEHLPPSPNVEVFKYDVMKDKLVEATNSFNSVPFTIQRLCELLTSPNKHYKRTDKFMRGIEKNMLVVSSLQSPRRSLESFEHNSSILNGAVEPISENGGPSVQLDSFVSAFTPANDRLQHSLSNHTHSTFNNITNDHLSTAIDTITHHDHDDDPTASASTEHDDHASPPPAKSPRHSDSISSPSADKPVASPPSSSSLPSSCMISEEDGSEDLNNSLTLLSACNSENSAIVESSQDPRTDTDLQVAQEQPVSVDTSEQDFQPSTSEAEVEPSATVDSAAESSTIDTPMETQETISEPVDSATAVDSSDAVETSSNDLPTDTAEAVKTKEVDDSAELQADAETAEDSVSSSSDQGSVSSNDY